MWGWYNTVCVVWLCCVCGVLCLPDTRFSGVCLVLCCFGVGLVFWCFGVCHVCCLVVRGSVLFLVFFGVVW